LVNHILDQGFYTSPADEGYMEASAPELPQEPETEAPQDNEADDYLENDADVSGALH
jgi:hypothetical protein